MRSLTQVIAELRSLLEGVTIEKRALQSSAAREQTQHSRSTPGSPQASPPPSPPRQSSDLPPHQTADPLARLLRGSMLDRPQGSGFTMTVAGSETDGVSRTSSGGSPPASAAAPGPSAMPSLQHELGGDIGQANDAAESHVAPLASALAPRASGVTQQSTTGAARSASGRLAQHGLGTVDITGSPLQPPGSAAAWRKGDGLPKNATGALQAQPDGGSAPPPATPSQEGRRQAPSPGAAASATSSLTESAAPDMPSGSQPASVRAVRRALAGQFDAAASDGRAANGKVQQAGAAAEEARQRVVAGLATALGRHEGDWGSAWGAGLSVMPSGASVSDASAASPVSSVDLLAPRPSCIVDVVAEPIITPDADPSPATAINQMLCNALGMADVAEDTPSAGADTALETITAVTDENGASRIRTPMPVQQQQRRHLMTRSADTGSRKALTDVPGPSTARYSAPGSLAPWRSVVPTSVFALSEPGQQLEAAALATRCGLPPNNLFRGRP